MKSSIRICSYFVAVVGICLLAAQTGSAQTSVPKNPSLGFATELENGIDLVGVRAGADVQVSAGELSAPRVQFLRIANSGFDASVHEEGTGVCDH